MRWALGLLLCCAALAGCTAGDDDPRPPNADPFAGESYPPVSSSTPPPTNGTDPSSSSSSSAAPPPAPPSAGDRFGAHGQEDSATDPAFSGLMLGGRLAGSGSLVRVEASANNFGERAYKVPDGCRTAWTESMAGPSGAVQVREPMSSCAGVTYKDFPAHDSMSREFEWNGTLWDAGSGAYVPAPAGTYTWRVVFDVYGGSGSPPPDHAALTMEFQVTVG